MNLLSQLGYEQENAAPTPENNALQNATTSQSFNRLCHATMPEKIVDALMQYYWEADGNEGKYPQTPEKAFTVFSTIISKQYNPELEEYIASEFTYVTPEEIEKNLDDLRQSELELSEFLNTAADAEQRDTLQEKTLNLKQDLLKQIEYFVGLARTPKDAFIMGKNLARTPKDAFIMGKHDEWKEDTSQSHPLKTIARECLTDLTTTHIDADYDSKHSTAILRSGSIGSIRDVVLDMEGVGQSLIIPNQANIESKQLKLWESRADSQLPDFLPWTPMWDGRARKTTRGGAIPPGMRVADEAFYPIKSGAFTAELKIDLGVLLNAFHPDLTEKQITSNRRKYLKHIIDGLHDIQYLGWEYTQNGKSGLWVPVKIHDHFMPSIKSSDDFPVRLTVTLPESPHSNGIASIKYAMRLTGKRSRPQRNVLRTAYWIFDRYDHIDPTKPVERRDNDGNLLTAEGKHIFDQHGKPIKKPYHPTAVKELDREWNPSALKTYPKLQREDLLRAAFPQGSPAGEQKKYFERAKRAWEAIEKEEFICIIKHPHGWQIMPSESYMKHYRFLRKSVQRKKKNS